jgi:hypothetical protein
LELKPVDLLKLFNKIHCYLKMLLLTPDFHEEIFKGIKDIPEFQKCVPMATPTPRRKGQTQTEYEKSCLEEMRKGPNPKEGPAWKYLTNRLGKSPGKPELVSLGIVLAQELGMHLTREYKRRKEMMIKWFNDNFDRLEPFLSSQVELVGEKRV